MFIVVNLVAMVKDESVTNREDHGQVGVSEPWSDR